MVDHRNRALALGALAAALTGCDVLLPQPCSSEGIRLEAPALDSLRVGRTVPLVARPNLCVNPQAEVDWEASGPGAARVLPTGRFTAVLVVAAPGEGTLRVVERGHPPTMAYALPYRAPVPVLAAVDRDPGALFQTDSLGHRLRAVERGWTGEIPVTFSNSRPDTVSFANCGGVSPVELQRQVRVGWLRVWRLEIPPCVSPAVRVGPGQSLRIRVPVFVSYPWLDADTAVDELPGVYRLAWDAVHAGAGDESGALLPEAHRVSNPFTLTVTGGG